MPLTTMQRVEAASAAGASPSPIEPASQLSLLRNGPLLALGAGHATIDVCTNVLPIFYPLIMAALHLSYASVGALLTVQATANALSQPLFGWLADRFGSRLLAPLSLLAGALALAAAGFASSYPVLLLSVAMLGLASGAYHPQGARAASLLGGRWRATAFSVYQVCGSGGNALGPLLAATLLMPQGRGASWVFLLPAVPVALLLSRQLRRADGAMMARGVGMRAAGSPPVAWIGVICLAVVIVVRAWVSNGLAGFLPVFYAGRGGPPEPAGQLIFLLLIMEGVGTALGGWLADRVGRKPVLIVSFLLLAPALHLFFAASGASAALLAAVVGLLMGCGVTVTVVSAQEVLPSRMGVATGIALSLNTIMGGVGVGAQGLLADVYGLGLAMEVLVVAVVVAAAASLGVGGTARPPSPIPLQ